MARTIYVKAAKQRYEQKPVLDENGQPKQTAVLTKKGEPKVTKTGRVVTMRITENDLSKPKPNYKCESCGTEIKVGQPYKHVTVKNTYGGTKHVRCDTCPTWQPWDLSNSLSARLAQVSHEFEDAVQSASDPSEVESALQDAAQAVRDIAEEKRESAQNIEDGFQHPTSQSEELQQIGDDLESWADEIESADVPELPDAEPRWFVTYNGEHLVADAIEAEGYETDVEAQADLDAYLAGLEEGHDDSDPDNYDVVEEEQDEPTEDQIEEWRDECISSLSIVDESPV